MALTAEDKLEIMELVARYNHAQDQDDYDGWVDTFTEDGVFESPRSGTRGGRSCGSSPSTPPPASPTSVT